MPIGPRKTHDICWINVITPEVERAKAFFGRLFGWTFAELPGVPGGELFRVDGRTAGALMDVAVCPPGTPAAIGVMVRVDDADATVAKIAALGGRTEGVWDALENGRTAHCFDPNGAVFGLWQPKKEVGMEHDQGAHGAPTWFETLTDDPKRAASFYAALFGWMAEEQPIQGGGVYTRFLLDGAPVAGAMKLPPHAEHVPPHWGTYFAVRDADATAALGVELGAKLCLPVMPIPGVGRFALLQSPEGVPFHLLERAR